MPTKIPQEPKSSTHIESSQPVMRMIPAVAFIFATVSMFLLGCFVIGPWYKNRHQSVMSTAAPAVTTDADSSPLPIPARPSRPARPEVTIKEVPQDNSVSDFSAPAEPQETDTITHPPVTDSAEQTATPEGVAAGPEIQALPEVLPSDTQTETEINTSIQPLFRVRAGIFADRANADVLSAKLSSAGFAPAVHHVERSGRQLYAVQLGAFRKRENAEELARSLRDAGFEAGIAAEN